MKTNFSVLLYMKKQKNYQSGFAPIYISITVSHAYARKARSCNWANSFSVWFQLTEFMPFVNVFDRRL